MSSCAQDALPPALFTKPGPESLTNSTQISREGEQCKRKMEKLLLGAEEVLIVAKDLILT